MSRRGGGSRAEFEEREYYSSREELPPARQQTLPTRVRERDFEEVVDYSRRGPERRRSLEFLREDYARPDPGPMVLRERETETVTRPERRQRSPSPAPRVQYRERVVERREPSPPPERERVRTRIVERERERSPSPERPQLRARVIETRERIRERTPSPPRVQIRERIVERERERSPSPAPVERVRTRIIERERPRSPSPEIIIRPETPPIVRAPPIHQEIITHHRHIDHGFERARVPTPPTPAPRPPPTNEKTEIDIYSSRNNTEIDITKTNSRGHTPKPPRREFYDDTIIYEQERDKLRVRDNNLEITRRRSVSARPEKKERFSVDLRERIRDDDSEADYYNRRAESRGYPGEAWNGSTTDWSIVDVPPGTEKVRMDGAGGGSQEITWQKYNGVRRSKFIPEREREKERSERIEIREFEAPAPPPPREDLSIEISTKRRAGGSTYEREYERIEESTDRRVGFPLPRGPPKNRVGDLWTEITKDLVVREAIEQLGYDFEETEFFYYIIQYLRYEDVEELVALSEQIRRERQHRLREIERERIRIEQREEERKEWERAERRRERDSGYDDERIIEREIIYDRPRARRSGGW